LAEETYIISSCAISNNAVLKNNEHIFSATGINFQSFLVSLYRFTKTEYPKFYKMDSLSKLGWLTSEILIRDESIIKQAAPEEVSIVITNANSSLDTDIKYFQTIETASPALFVYTLPNILIGEICIRNNFKGENACFVFEDFNAAFIEQYVNELFTNNNLKFCICGWVDVLQEEYKAVLFLVSKSNAPDALAFTEQEMNKIFKTV
jgi:hypothetical protein